jgi:hypothetical protein
MNQFREHYNPDPVNIHPRLCFSDLMLVWLSGVSIGLVIGLIATGN